VRSVFVFPRLGSEEIIRRLDDLAGPASLDQWVLDNVLWIRLVDRDGGLYADWDEDLQRALARAEGGTAPTRAVIADVSSHVAGDAIVKRLVEALTDCNGHVLDDYGDSIWTASQVITGEVVYGWPGFSRSQI
jgi:hypothetical protein